MKKTFNVAIGGRSFIIDVDAYSSLSTYLNNFKVGLSETDREEVMDELEMRIADLFREKLKGREVVDIRIADEVIEQLGMPQWVVGEMPDENNEKGKRGSYGSRRLYRDLKEKILGGVCSGLSLYLNFDVTIIRLIFIIAIFIGSAGLWIYLLLWLIVPPARTASQKCEVRGLPATAENIRRFSIQNKQQ